MKTRILLLLASLALAFMTYYVLYAGNWLNASKGFVNIDPSEVSSVVISFKGEKYSFARKNNIWQSLNQDKKTIDQKYFRNFLRDLTMLPVTQTIAETADNLKIFGLDSPSAEVEIKHGQAGKIARIILGNNNEAGTSTYAKMEERDEIVLLGIILKQDIEHIITEISTSL